MIYVLHLLQFVFLKGVVSHYKMNKKERALERRRKRLQEVAEARSIPYDNRWWSAGTLAVVTGSNRGIGFQIVNQLAKEGLSVVLTSRNQLKGEEAIASLKKNGLNVAFHQLDLLNLESIESFAKWIQDQYGGIDILVNNAGVNFNTGSNNSVKNAKIVIETNYYGMKRMTQAMLPFMKPSPMGARILNVSSRLGRINGRRNRIENQALRNQLENEELLSEELIDTMLKCFLEEVDIGTWISGGWQRNFTDYSVSKLAVNAYTRLLARRLSTRPDGQKIFVNCYCPGWVKTDMNAGEGNVTAEEGADTAVWTILHSAKSPTGKFFAERREISF